jgi:hypothetical protein
MQRYGLMVADNGSNWYFQGTRDGHWTNNLLDQLKTVPASAFEAVDVSGCMVDVDSGEADCPYGEARVLRMRSGRARCPT